MIGDGLSAVPDAPQQVLVQLTGHRTEIARPQPHVFGRGEAVHVSHRLVDALVPELVVEHGHRDR